MKRRAYVHMVTLLALALAACAAPNAVGGAGTPGPRRNGPTSKPTASAPGSSLGPTASPTAGLVAPPRPGGPGVASQTPKPGDGGTLLSDAGASLIGKVKAPAGLLSDAGAAIISDVGVGLVSNNGGSYRLLAVEQKPVAGARVTLLDGKGEPVKDAAGKPFEARTDAAGTYAFTQALPAIALVVRVELPGDKGELQAIATLRDGKREAGVDLFSTLVSAYVVREYVRPQTDPVGVLGKLPADVEARTRGEVERAFGGKAPAVPSRMTPELAATACGELRAGDQGLDRQLEVVRKILVAAGQEDLGAGLPATEVALSVGFLAAGPDGLPLIGTPEGRIWKLTADGKLATVAGAGVARLDVEGKPGAAAGLDSIGGLAVEPDGELLILEHATREYATLGGENARISRLGKDGKIDVLASLWGAKLIVPGANGAVLVLADDKTPDFGPATSASVWEIAADGTKRKLKTLEGADGSAIARSYRVRGGSDGQGGMRLLAAVQPEGFFTFLPDQVEFRISADGQTVTRGATHKVLRVACDYRGNVFALPDEPVRDLTVSKPDGGTGVIMAGVPKATLDYLWQAMLTPDGTLYTLNGSRLFKLAAGALVPVAGLDPQLAGTVDNPAIVSPAGIAPLPGGRLLVVDRYANRILELDAARKARVVAGVGDAPASDKAEPPSDVAAKARLNAPGRIFALSDGGFVFADNSFSGGEARNRLRKVDAAGKIADLADPAGELEDFVATPDGTIVYVTLARDATDARIVKRVALGRIVPGGQATELLGESGGDGLVALALDPAGKVYFATGGRLRRLEGDKLVDVAVDSRFAGVWPGSLVVDRAGRVYITDVNTDQILRFDPATRRTEAIAGKGTARLNGAGIDDSIRRPGFPVLDAAGNLYFADSDHRQVKKLDAAELE